MRQYSLSVALTLFFNQGPLFFQYGSLIHDSSQLGGVGGGILRSGGFCYQLTGLVVQLAQPPFNIGRLMLSPGIGASSISMAEVICRISVLF